MPVGVSVTHDGKHLTLTRRDMVSTSPGEDLCQTWRHFRRSMPSPPQAAKHATFSWIDLKRHRCPRRWPCKIADSDSQVLFLKAYKSIGYYRFHFLAFILLTFSNQKKNAAEQAKPHLEHHPLSLLETCHAMSLRKLHNPVRTGLCPISSPGSSGPSHGRLPLGCEQQTPALTQTWMGQSACLLLNILHSAPFSRIPKPFCQSS